LIAVARRRCGGAGLLAASAVLLGACAAATGPNKAPAASQGVYFVAPVNGATVTSPFMVRFGLKGMEVRPAGEQVSGTGHHHLLINRDSLAPGQIIPVDDVHIHFGKGQTETELKLQPGTYKLTLQFADGFHLSYGKDMSASLTVTVK
jgi:hypothetical protein